MPSKLSDTRRGPPPSGRPPSAAPGPGSGRGAPPPRPHDEHPATAGPQPARPASRGPAPASQPHKKPGPKQDPKAGAPAFEIRRGRANPDGSEADDDEKLGPVVLPRSITQEAEEERLKERFGVDHLPEVQEVNSLVRMTESQGTHGPDRSRRRLMMIVLVILLALGGAAFVAHQQGLLKGLLGGP